MTPHGFDKRVCGWGGGGRVEDIVGLPAGAIE
jgi:hypothetical protein